MGEGLSYSLSRGFSGGVSGKEPACQYRRQREVGLIHLGLEDPLEEGMAHVGRPGVWRGCSENGQGGQCIPALAPRVLCPRRPLSPTQTGVVGQTGAKV